MLYCGLRLEIPNPPVPPTPKFTPPSRVWEQRAVFVCHNYLFECLPDLRHGIIGFAMLAGAQIALKRCGVLTMATTAAEAMENPDFATGTGTGSDPTRPILARTHTEALHITVLTRSKFDSERASFWVRGPGMFSCKLIASSCFFLPLTPTYCRVRRSPSS